MGEWEDRAIRRIVDYFGNSQMSEEDRLRIVAGYIGTDLNLSHQRARQVAYCALHPSSSLPQSARWRDRGSSYKSLKEEHSRQAGKMAELFAGEVNMTEEDYISSLPPFPVKPEVSGILRPLIVEGSRIPRERQAEISRFGFSILKGKVADWEDDPLGFITPVDPYTTWIHISEKTTSDMKSARRKLTPDQRGGNVFEAISFWNNFSDIAKYGLFNLPGSQVNKYRIYNDEFYKKFYRDDFIYLNATGYGLSTVSFREHGESGQSCNTLISFRNINLARYLF